MTGSDQVRVPKGLRRAGAALFSSVAVEFSVDDPAGLALLETACVAFDRLRAAEAAIRERGELIDDRYGGVKLNPACKLELDSRNGFLAAMRALNLDLEPLRDLARGRQPENSPSRPSAAGPAANVARLRPR